MNYAGSKSLNTQITDKHLVCYQLSDGEAVLEDSITGNLDNLGRGNVIR